MSDRALLEHLWWSDGALPTLARAALTPAAIVYGGVIALRGALYDAGILRTRATAIPAISVGNLSVGGTGKTPVAAWIAAALVTRGAHPAIVLRGYGEDEPLVHRELNPGVPVVTAPDRVAGTARAYALGADIAVLDDGFQHRAAARVCDIVLVSADRWPERWRLLPAGPMREPLDALRRASLVIVTRKAVAADVARHVVDEIAAVVPSCPAAIVHLAVDELRGPGGAREPLAMLQGRAVLAIASIADPRAFVAQLAAVGAVAEVAAFADHHDFSEGDITRLARAAGGPGLAVCTLKDHVKLAPLWPRGAPPLWYVSQRVELELGGEAVDACLDTALRARSNLPRVRR